MTPDYLLELQQLEPTLHERLKTGECNCTLGYWLCKFDPMFQVIFFETFKDRPLFENIERLRPLYKQENKCSH